MPFGNKLLTQPAVKGQWKGLFLKSGSGLPSITCVAESKVPSSLRALSPVSLLPRSSSSRSFVANVVNLFKALLGEDSLSPQRGFPESFKELLLRCPAPGTPPCWFPCGLCHRTYRRVYSLIVCLLQSERKVLGNRDSSFVPCCTSASYNGTWCRPGT